MKYAVGIDSVDIDRFSHWITYQPEQLNRILSTDEITYCMSSPAHAAQRFAVRFAAREALYKAWCSASYIPYFPLLKLCRAARITHTPQGAARFEMDWALLNLLSVDQPQIALSMTHSRYLATAIVIVAPPDDASCLPLF